MGGSEAQAAADASTLASAMANLDVDPGEKLQEDQVKELEPQPREAESREADFGKDGVQVAESVSIVDKSSERNGEVVDTEKERNEERAVENSDDGKADTVQKDFINGEDQPKSLETRNEGNEDESNFSSRAQEQSSVDTREGVVQIMTNAATLMEKLSIGESDDGASNGGDDDVSSSLDSTANSGHRLVEGEETSQEDKLVSSEDCSEDGSVRPKKRIDLQHQFVRGIVKIQQDRDQYEKQCQNKKQDEIKERDVKTPDKVKVDTGSQKTSSSRGSPHSTPAQASKRQYSSVDGPPARTGLKLNEEPQVDKIRHDRSGAIYRPPSLRNNADTDTIRSTRNADTDTSKSETTRSIRNIEIDTTRSMRNAETDATRSGPISTRNSILKLSANAPASKVPLRTNQLDKEILPETVGITVTFDTERQKRHIQLSKPSGSQGKEENNFIVTFDTTRKERHIEIPNSSRAFDRSSYYGPGDTKDKTSVEASKHRSDLPASFEFKATAYGKEARPADNSASGKKSSHRARGSKFSGNASSSPKDHSGNDVNYLNGNSKRNDVAPLPPKDKPFAAELRWSDIVESESEPSPSPKAVNSSSSTPDVLESNKWHSGSNQSNSSGRKASSRKHRQKKELGNSQPRQQSEAPATENTSRRSVWERLGPRPVVDNSRLRTVHYENSSVATTLESFREAAERDYFCKGENPVYGEENSVHAAYKDTKQKRTRLELYVPRRGGSQA